MIDFLFRSTTRKDFEAMARTAAFVDADNKPMPGIAIDPQITKGIPAGEMKEVRNGSENFPLLSLAGSRSAE